MKKSSKIVDINRDKKGSDTSKPSTVIGDPIGRFLSGGEVATGSQLYSSGKLREEYSARSAAIPKNLSKETQATMRSNLRSEIRSRQNAFSEAVVKNIDKQRAAEDAESLRKGEPSKYKTDHAQSTNNAVNEFGKKCKAVGTGMALIGLSNETLQVINAPEGSRLKEATRAVGRQCGGLIGGRVGAEACLKTRAPGIISAGAFVGGTVGSMVGEKAVDAMWYLFGNK